MKSVWDSQKLVQVMCSDNGKKRKEVYVKLACEVFSAEPRNVETAERVNTSSLRNLASFYE